MVRQTTNKKDLKKAAALVSRLGEIATDLDRGLEDQLHELLELGCELLELEVGVVAMIDDDRYEVSAISVPPDVGLEAGQILDLDDTFCARTVEEDGPVTIAKAAKSDLADCRLHDTYGIQSYIGIPLRLAYGQSGTFSFSGLAPRRRGFSDSDVDILRMMAGWLGTELARRQAEDDAGAAMSTLEETKEELHNVATHDSLTGVLNRRAVLEHLGDERNRASRESTNIGVFLMDVDRYRRVNDAIGYRGGDLLLVDIVSRVTDCLRSYDHIGRLAGKQFLAVLPGCDLAEAAEIAERGRVAIEERVFPQPEGELDITASFGVTSTDDPDLTDDQLLATADKALFLAKQRGKNMVRGATPHAIEAEVAKG
jgi:diguanylate cyclase (GGDEF)-like protein